MNLFNTFVFENGTVLKNRFVMAPMTTYSANDDLTLSIEEEKYFKARGKNFGMVITQATAISKHAQAFKNQISIKDESYLPSMKRLAKAIKSGGAKAVVQLHHGGRMNALNLFDNQDIVSASAVKAERENATLPRALSNEEVYQLIDDFVNATKLAIKAGFDGVELHGANTYLIQQFFSPHSNQREDEFGGTLDKRMRFLLLLIDRVVKAKKQYADKVFIIGYRLSPEELENPGIRIEDTLELIKELNKKEIDYIHLSLGQYNQSSMRNKNDQEMIIKKIVNTSNVKPIIGVGQIDDLEKAKDAYSLGYSLLAIGMASLADPDFVKHLENNIKPKKTLDQLSLLPQALYERLHMWRGLEDRGFHFKE